MILNFSIELNDDAAKALGLLKAMELYNAALAIQGAYDPAVGEYVRQILLRKEIQAPDGTVLASLKDEVLAGVVQMGAYYFGIGRQDKNSKCWEVSTSISGSICSALKDLILEGFDKIEAYYPSSLFRKEVIEWVKERWL